MSNSMILSSSHACARQGSLVATAKREGALLIRNEGGFNEKHMSASVKALYDFVAHVPVYGPSGVEWPRQIYKFMLDTWDSEGTTIPLSCNEIVRGPGYDSFRVKLCLPEKRNKFDAFFNRCQEFLDDRGESPSLRDSIAKLHEAANSLLSYASTHFPRRLSDKEWSQGVIEDLKWPVDWKDRLKSEDFVVMLAGDDVFSELVTKAGKSVGSKVERAIQLLAKVAWPFSYDWAVLDVILGAVALNKAVLDQLNEIHRVEQKCKDPLLKALYDRRKLELVDQAVRELPELYAISKQRPVGDPVRNFVISPITELILDDEDDDRHMKELIQLFNPGVRVVHILPMPGGIPVGAEELEDWTQEEKDLIDWVCTFYAKRGEAFVKDPTSANKSKVIKSIKKLKMYHDHLAPASGPTPMET